MTSTFLSRLFLAAPLPAPVLVEVFDAYPRYHLCLARNPYLGSLTLPLAKRLLLLEDSAPIISMIMSGSPVVRDLVLAAPSNSAEVILAMATVWDLSLAHRHLLAAVAPSPVVRHVALYGPPSFPHTSTVSAPTGMYTQISLPPLPDPSHQSSLRPRRPHLNTPPDLPHTPLDLDLNQSVASLAQRSYSQFEKYGPIFATHLGLGDTSFSLRSWMLFLSLCENDPAVPTVHVISSALRLSQAELF